MMLQIQAWNSTSKGPFKTHGWVELATVSDYLYISRSLSDQKPRRTKSPLGYSRPKGLKDPGSTNESFN